MAEQRGTEGRRGYTFFEILERLYGRMGACLEQKNKDNRHKEETYGE